VTAVPLGIAFVVGRRPANRRYTYGYGRAEDLAGVVIVVFIAASSAVAAYAAVTRLAHPRPVTNLIAVAVAAVIGFTGNEVVARYRIRVGRKIGSAAPPACAARRRGERHTPPSAAHAERDNLRTLTAVNDALAQRAESAIGVPASAE